jgi:hypothetical protein
MGLSVARAICSILCFFPISFLFFTIVFFSRWGDITGLSRRVGYYRHG